MNNRNHLQGKRTENILKHRMPDPTLRVLAAFILCVTATLLFFSRGVATEPSVGNPLTNKRAAPVVSIEADPVFVNDDDANDNQIWDKDDAGPVAPGPRPLTRISYTITPSTANPYNGNYKVTMSAPGNIAMWKDELKVTPFVFDPQAMSGAFFAEASLFSSSARSELWTFAWFALDGSGLTAYSTAQTGNWQIDMDIDSDNDGDGPDETEAEDQIEFSAKEEFPGKISLISPGFATGLGFEGAPNALTRLIPIKVKLKAPFTLADGKVRFDYIASIPRLDTDGGDIHRESVDAVFKYSLNKGGFRLWKSRTRDKKPISKGGDFIPAGTDIAVNLFDGLEFTIYLEYVDKYPTTAHGKQPITVTGKQHIPAVAAGQGNIQAQPARDIAIIDQINTYALPLEILQPKLDGAGEVVKGPGGVDEMVSVSSVRFTRWANAFSEPDSTFQPGFESTDKDRFVVRVVSSAEPNLKVGVKGITNTTSGATEDDPDIEGVVGDGEGAQKVWTSDPLLLVTDPGSDTGYNGPGGEDLIGDATHLGSFDALVRAVIPNLGSKVEGNVPAMKKTAEVKMTIKVMSLSWPPTADEAAAAILKVTKDFNYAQEVYAQIGVRLILEDARLLPADDKQKEIFDDGVLSMDLPLDTGEQVAFFSTLPPTTDTTRVLITYVPGKIRYPDGREDAGFTINHLIPAREGSVVISMDTAQKMTLAHEVGHALGLKHPVPGTFIRHRLMTDGGTIYIGDHRDSKRFNLDEENKIVTSKYYVPIQQ